MILKHKRQVLPFILFTLLLIPSITFSQAKQDSLLSKLKQASAIEAREIFKALSEELSLERYPTFESIKPAIQHIEQATAHSNSPQAKLFAQIAILKLKNQYKSRVKIKQVLAFYEQVKSHHPLIQADIATLICNKIMFSKNKPKALSYALEASQVYDSLNLKADLANSYYQICILNYWGGNFKTSKSYYQKIIDLNLIGLSDRQQINTINTGGLIAKKHKEYDLAIENFKKAEALAVSYKDTVWIGIAKGNIGDVYVELKQYKKAKPYLLEDLKYSKQYQSHQNIVINLNQLGDIAFEQKQFQTAYHYYQEALATVQKQGVEYYVENTMRTYKNLAKASRALYLYNQAFDFLEQANYWKDSLHRTTIEREILAIQRAHDYAQQEKELAILKKAQVLTEKNQQLKLGIAIIGGAILAVALFFIWISYNKQRQANALLNKQKQQIEEQSSSIHHQNNELIKREGVFQDLLDALAEDEQKIKSQNQKLQIDKEQLIEQVTHRTHELVIKNKELLQNNTQLEQFNYVIAHNIRGPVARLLGLFQLYEASNEEEKQTLWPKITSSAHDIDTVIKDLNITLRIKKNINEVYEQVDLSELINRVFKTLQGTIDEAEAKFEVNLEILHVNSVKAYIESILYNLISNALKYRDEKRPLQIQISSQQVNNRVVFSIADNGLGIDLEKYHEQLFGMYKRFHVHKEGKGLGLHLVKLQVESLGGHIAVESELGKGTTFRVYL